MSGSRPIRKQADNFRIADDSYSICPNHLKRLVFIRDLQG